MKPLSFITVATVLALTFTFVELSIHPVQAATHHVDDDNCPGPGTGTQVDPFCAIQSGIDAASSGDTVQVAAGTYNENITMKDGVVIQGAGQNVSIIDAEESGSVVTATGVDSAAKLDGFTITNGNATYGGGMYNAFHSEPTVTNCTFSGNSADYGGGMYNDSSSPTVSNCTFSGNTATEGGGGMENHLTSSPTVTNCTFSGNSAGYQGGGMDNDAQSSPTVTNCTFSENTAGTDGGGMNNHNYSSPTVTNCTFSGNSAVYGGGMLHYDNSTPTVTNSTFSGNSASLHGGGMFNGDNSSSTVTNCIFLGNLAGNFGGGMFNYLGSSPTVTNCTFSGNSTSLYGGGIYNDLSSSPTVTNCILWGDSPEAIYDFSFTLFITYSDIQGGFEGTGNINADPKFVDQGNGDLHLQQGSPCVDAGDNSAPALPTTDIDGDNRKIDDPKVADTGNGTPPIVDIGADEYILEVKAMPWIPLMMFSD